ncbi:hypothetical protein [Arthrobacter sp. B6]|uniref:hypothetical protein n=1 Tax=Arthrobacter sp. B6 TaxID=1570137 RepID=UPI0008339161|nr:hypothetical protein [Arthrobacter sp. B6]
MIRTAMPAEFPGIHGLPAIRRQAAYVGHWENLWCREFIELRCGAAVVGAGWVDEIADDGTVIWVNRINGLGRSMIHRSDGIDVWRVDSRVQGNRPQS